MPALATIALLAAASARAAEYVPTEPIPPDVQLGAFHDLIAQKSDFVLCLQVNDGDPPPEVMTRLQGPDDIVVRASECARAHTGAYRRGDHGAAEFLILRNVHVYGGGIAELEYVRFRHALWSSSGELSLRRKGPVWVVYARKLGPIS